jgi:hypothetical protein
MLERLAIAIVQDEADRKKIIKLSHQFMKVADFRHRVIHDEPIWSSPATGTVGFFRAETTFTPRGPTEVSAEWLAWHSALSFEVQARMQQYRIKNPRWSDDEHFPWHGKPPPQPRRTSQEPQKPK